MSCLLRFQPFHHHCPTYISVTDDEALSILHQPIQDRLIHELLKSLSSAFSLSLSYFISSLFFRKPTQGPHPARNRTDVWFMLYQVFSLSFANWTWTCRQRIKGSPWELMCPLTERFLDGFSSPHTWLLLSLELMPSKKTSNSRSRRSWALCPILPVDGPLDYRHNLKFHINSLFQPTCLFDPTLQDSEGTLSRHTSSPRNPKVPPL